MIVGNYYWQAIWLKIKIGKGKALYLVNLDVFHMVEFQEYLHELEESKLIYYALLFIDPHWPWLKLSIWKAGVVVHTGNPSTQGAEAGGSGRSSGQLGLYT